MDIRANWERFLGGYWQQEMPQIPGEYPVWARLLPGENGLHRMEVYLNPYTGEPTPVQSWGGLWWSEPYPDMPSPPEELLKWNL